MKLHPPIVHFAIAFPVFLLVIDVYYRVTKRELDRMHALLTYLTVLSVVLGTVSGIIAHEPIEELLEKIPIFETHERLGLFLAVFFLILGAVRFFRLRNVFTIMLTVGVLLLFIQGNLGGRIVYDHLIKLMP
ncbi:MAG: DUF2231 domain-containing protein [Aquificaceae bacterium]